MRLGMEKIKGYEDLTLLERRLKFLIEDTPGEFKVPLWLESHSGLGKTTRVKDFIEKKLNRGCHILYLATQDVGDLIGLMAEGTTLNNEKKEEAVTKWLKTEWFSKIKEGDVLVFDEFNRAPIYIINAIMSILLENRLHTHELPKNVQKIALCNNDDGDYQVTSITDPAVLSRFIRLQYDLDHKDWVKYAKNNGVCPAMIEAITVNSVALKPKESNYKLDYYPNYRGVTLMGRIMDIPDELYELIDGYELVQGMLGPTLATTYEKARKDVLTVIDVNTLMSDYSKVKLQVKKAYDKKDPAIIDQLNRAIIFKLGKLLETADTKDKLENCIKNETKLSTELHSIMVNINSYLLDTPDSNILVFFTLFRETAPIEIVRDVLLYFDNQVDSTSALSKRVARHGNVKNA